MLQRGRIRTGIVLTSIALLTVILVSVRPMSARAVREAAREAFVTAPLNITPTESAQLTVFLPAIPGPHVQEPMQLLMFDAETGQVLAQKDLVVVGPGGGSLQFALDRQLPDSHMAIVGVLIGLLKPGSARPVASLQIIDNATQQTVAALPAVQLTITPTDQ